jgi:hypothetical protein
MVWCCVLTVGGTACGLCECAAANGSWRLANRDRISRCQRAAGCGSRCMVYMCFYQAGWLNSRRIFWPRMDLTTEDTECTESHQLGAQSERGVDWIGRGFPQGFSGHRASEIRMTSCAQ